MTWEDEAGQVGIFWAVPDPGGTNLATEATRLAVAEQYGEFLTHPNGHHETWTAWQTLSPWSRAQRGLPVAIACYEYEELPRGRIVFYVPDGVFTVYADKRLLKPAMQARIMAAFSLPAGRTRLRTDPHYRTTSLQGDAR